MNYTIEEDVIDLSTHEEEEESMVENGEDLPV